ncbi:MAG: Crp/Fnr family transcriptional regulator [Saprospiraceae bacterium]|nr:Crp/Fnr family transcriptional regulator [Saprospiraceae bacterium]MCB9323309.1 Crp/Fnr family transcriptional regulator [Lewinellaceae bacterium]
MDDFKIFKDFLKDVSFLTEKDCSLFEPYLKTKNYLSKDYFLSEGKVCHEIGFVNKGCFRTFYLSDGKEINTHFTFENEFVTDYDSFLQSKSSRYFIQALEDAEIVTFNLTALQDAYNQSQNWERFGRMIAEQSYKLTTQRVESFLFLDGQQRYLDLLNKQPHILDRIPLYHIASYLGLERESLSRLRKKIARK